MYSMARAVYFIYSRAPRIWHPRIAASADELLAPALAHMPTYYGGKPSKVMGGSLSDVFKDSTGFGPSIASQY